MAMAGLPKNTPQIPMQKIFYLDILITWVLAADAPFPVATWCTWPPEYLGRPERTWDCLGIPWMRPYFPDG